MTTNEHPQPAACTAQPPADLTYADARDTAWTTTVWALTLAARLRDPSQGHLDFADFLASAVTATAANVGSLDHLLAGRSGSWEADLVSQLVTGTAGYDPDDLDALIGYRTEPVVIHLNVARLVEEDAWDRGRNTDLFHEEIQAVDESFPRLNHAGDERAYDDAVSEVEAAWTARYTAYADAFTAAVHAAAAQVPGLSVPVTVHAITDPHAPTDTGPAHPDEYASGDLLVNRLWLAAYNTVPLPTTDAGATASDKGVGGAGHGL